MFLIIGLPVFQREWILPTWFRAIEHQDFSLADIGFIFLVSPDDLATIRCLHEFHHVHPELRCFEILSDTGQHEHHPEGRRLWSGQRYERMAQMRNRILDQVVCHDPDRYFSLDSDIILEDPRTLNRLVDITEWEADAAAPLTFMTPQGTGFPDTMTWDGAPGGRAWRPPAKFGTAFPADIIMAVNMMTKPVYTNVRYRFHPQGEDLGWSADANCKGFRLYAAFDVFCPHVMSRAQLEHYLREGDPRMEVVRST